MRRNNNTRQLSGRRVEALKVVIIEMGEGRKNKKKSDEAQTSTWI